MGTSLTPDFWKLFAALLAISTAATFVVSAALDALVLRLQRRRRQRRLPAGRPDGALREPSRPRQTLVRH
ncbi:hypothetical protein [Streptomyces sp. 142MFCol3.1]|uniref:hypothetical protein n=1 Tax=Streptomyces sp. 142MFCol3.1 TaxID=1172179 RepID=UPI0004105BC4|nr:hypothetical protein [Streptomyces sp. 142MFCol3.1]